MFLFVVSSCYRQEWWGLLEYKAQWTLTLEGWALVFLAIIIMSLLIFIGIQPFLALSVPLRKADILVVEGWVSDEVIKGAIAEFKNKDYQLMITTGIFFSQDKHLGHYKSQAEVAAAKAIALGLEVDKVIPVAASDIKMNRTAASAIAVKDWLIESNTLVKKVNLYSYDVHTRRSWLIFKRVLGTQMRVGAIAYPSPYYEAKQWWTASEGVRSVISETIAYIYALLIWRYDQFNS
ncbi:conserved hypothetical protein [Rippkaea orientalis PCC 8801]|uniref:DUF218 domain-containing protein n=1 Tax=Rippkaea orientalis (strain PCC 8801 / RF-1) TaxID=41431 RepID=B7K509_RIPO1|nr:ElyC/SanA/YdcF family protein [Rippkaea orientalis]ACK66665.1 conserved hypothetical protein [Rippkaea orientalis PCC 8801]